LHAAAAPLSPDRKRRRFRADEACEVHAIEDVERIDAESQHAAASVQTDIVRPGARIGDA
jgi:hypothetical protein